MTSESSPEYGQIIGRLPQHPMETRHRAQAQQSVSEDNSEHNDQNDGEIIFEENERSLIELHLMPNELRTPLSKTRYT